MPVGPLTFRAVCGDFVNVFVNRMYKRVLVYRLSHVNTVKLCSLRLSFTLVFLIATLYTDQATWSSTQDHHR